MSVKCLTKIGILLTENEDKANSVIFRHNGKSYKSLIDLDFTQLTADIKKNRDFCVVGLKCDDTDYCTIFHDGTRSPGRYNIDARGRIISLAFPEVNWPSSSPSCEDQAEEEDQTVVMNYVSTKLYDLLRTAHQEFAESRVSHSLDYTRLQATLRTYQEKTIQWLLQRERESIDIPHFYKKLTSTEGCQCYVNLMDFDIKDDLPKNIPIPSGGILADEMGLGKTVEILALILSNPRKLSELPSPCFPEKHPPAKKPRRDIKLMCVCRLKSMKKLVKCANCLLAQHEKCVMSYVRSAQANDEDYICPKCWEVKNILVRSAATVIVSPHPIKLQWLSEIKKHTNPPLEVLLYEGVTKRALCPREIANYDVILTDYNILRREIHFTASNETNISFRRERQVMRVNSPLMYVEWWRVCLDEAQMESTTSQASQIVKQLPAVHRWAVTGTPIQHSLDDLTSLLEFIGFHEVSSGAVWQNLAAEFIRGHCEKLVNVLQKVMWRTCKQSVLDELGIPPQSEVVHFVDLNNVEQLFYSDEHADCSTAFYDKIRDYTDLTGMPSAILKNILQPMLKLRQDCTIPVLRLKSEQNVVKKFLQPQELLEHLKCSNELECKTQLRTMASNYNGMAAIYFLQKQYTNAIKYYELVMKLAKEYTGNISVDSLLQIHALHNMIQASRIIETTDSFVVEEYQVQCNKLEWKYLEQYALNLQNAHKAYTSALKALQESEEKLPTDAPEFWAMILEVVDKENLADVVLHKINDEVFVSYSTSLYERFRSTHSILLILNLWFDKIKKVRKELCEKFSKLNFFVENVRPRNDVPVREWRLMTTFIRNVYDCHLSEFRNKEEKKKPEKEDKPKKVCQLCEIQRVLKNYECLIFNKILDEKSSNAEGTWNPTMQETILKAIYSSIKTKKEFTETVKDCELQLEAINLLKTEYKELVKLWIEIEYTVKAYDEMDMCKMRISLAESEEEKTKYQICAHEMDEILGELQMSFYSAQKEFIIKNSRLRYLKHLEKDTDPGPCPICCAEKQIKYVMLDCGHHMCLMCLKKMSKLQKTVTFNCSICRNEQKYENLYYVNRKPPHSNGESEVKGDYSSKIQEIVLEILKLKTNDEKVKILIFSQWQPILKAISDALEENSITFKLKWSPLSIQQFKDESLGITCMLMLLHHGSHGLNLVEATHVFLVEPILNPGEELQAIGRVHRIGQTRPTTVHRFIVRNTIEENIYNAVAKDTSRKWSNLSIDNIKKLFKLKSETSQD